MCVLDMERGTWNGLGVGELVWSFLGMSVSGLSGGFWGGGCRGVLGFDVVFVDGSPHPQFLFPRWSLTPRCPDRDRSWMCAGRSWIAEHPETGGMTHPVQRHPPS